MAWLWPLAFRCVGLQPSELFSAAFSFELPRVEKLLLLLKQAP